MKAHIVIDPNGGANANSIEIYGVKITETYSKEYLTDFVIPKVSSGDVEPEPKILDARRIKEHIRLVGYMDDKTDKDDLVDFTRKHLDATIGSQVDFYILSNDGVLETGSSYPATPNKATNNMFSTNPTVEHLQWIHNDTSGGANIMRLRFSYEDDEQPNDTSYTGRYVVDIELRRAKKVGQ